MVWIHGGSFAYGSGSQPDYQGHNLSKLGVVVVTINYRLGPFGFLAHPLLSKESPKGVSGNYRLLDQIQALKWVRANIAGFGGDKGLVTIFGESAGGLSISQLLVSPLSKGLFQRAIAESEPLWDRGLHCADTVSLKDGEKMGEQFAAALGCDKAKDPLAAMRAKTPDELLKAWKFTAAQLALPEGIQFLPVVDGWFLPDKPEALFKAGKQHDVPVLFGSNKDDGTLFGAIVHAKGMTVAQYEARIQSAYGTYAPELLRMFPATSDAEVGSAYANLLTQTEFAAFARFVCQSASVKKTKAYLYQFTHVPPTQEGALLGAFHGAEMPYVFGNLSASQGYTQMDMDLSKVIMGYWTRFAASGDPNGGGRPNWPFYGPKDQNLELGEQVKVNSGLFKQACDLADKIYVGGKP